MTSFELIENAGPNSVFATLKHLLKSAIAVDVQVAFTTTSGLDLLLPRLLNVATSGHVRFLTGLYQSNTEPAALKKLLRTQQDYGDRFQVRLSAETHFHRKAVLIRTRSTLYTVIGSSNFTKNGFLSAGELSALVSVSAKTKKAKATEDVFKDAWKEGVALEKAQIERYAASRPVHVEQAVSKSELKAILGPTAKHGAASGPTTENKGAAGREPKHWIDGVEGYVADETTAVVCDETNWDGKWAWRECSDGYRPDDEVVLLERTNKPGWAVLTRVTATTRTATKTPDGRHFVAYRHVPRVSQRKLTRDFVRRLKDAGIRRTDGQRAVVSRDAWERTRKLFRR